MNSPDTYLFVNFAASIVGIACAFCAPKIPSHGWLAVVLVLVVTLACILINAGDSSSLAHLSMSVTFCLGAPFTVVYSFRAKKHAPDKPLALAAFVGSLIVAILFLTMQWFIFYFLFKKFA